MVGPEDVELLAEQNRSCCPEVGAEDVAELDLVFVGTVFRPAEDVPPAVFEQFAAAAADQMAGLRGADLIDGLAQLGHDVKAVEHVQAMSGPLANDLQVRLPHVATDEAKPLDPIGTEPIEERPESFRGPLLTDPDQPAHTDVDLVDKRQISLPEFPLNLVDSDCFDS